MLNPAKHEHRRYPRLAGGAERTESAVPEFDVAIRGGTVVTAAHVSRRYRHSADGRSRP